QGLCKTDAFSGGVCLWQVSIAAPFLSVRSISSSSSQQRVGGKVRTVYEYNIQDNVDDSKGMLVHSRKADFQSDVLSPEVQQEIRNMLLMQ
ncbi:hypothetical protein KR018_010750, partial [Drosophila ironensis]